MEKQIDRACAERLMLTFPHFPKLVAHAVKDHSANLEYTLSFSQFHVLRHLAEGDCLSTELAKHLHVANPTITSIIDGLVERGLVERRHDPANRRAVPLSVTPKGQELFTTLLDAALGVVGEMISSMPEEEKWKLFDSLGALQQAMDEYGKSKGQRDLAVCSASSKEL
jgi:DNA-binding MarR family transcriptional regulator